MKIMKRKTITARHSNTVTMSFSLDAETKQRIEEVAALEKKSKSDVIRDLVRTQKRWNAWQTLQEESRPFAEKHNLQSDEDVFAFFA